MEKVINKYEFGGSHQQNRGEYLEAVVAWYYSDCNFGIKGLSRDKLNTAIDKMCQMVIGPGNKKVRFPDGTVWNEEELSESIEDTIVELFF